MKVKATKKARFFIQNEYSQVVVQNNTLIISSSSKEEIIPFSVWSGEINIERGLFWGTLTFYSHQKALQVTCWSVQGLPWNECETFARRAIQMYREWYSMQCKELKQRLPQWREALTLLQKQPAYLPDSAVYSWRDTVLEQLQEMNMTVEEAEQRMPKSMSVIQPWLTDIENLVDERNEHWLENERLNWEVLFSQIESSPLNISQQHAVLLNNDNNLVLAGAGTGKTSVLTARIAYLLQSHLAQAESLLMLAFGKEAVKEMEQRLKDKIGSGASGVTVNTFHQLGLHIINSVEQKSVEISPYAVDNKQKHKWCSEWLRSYWQTPTNYKRWQKHLSEWPIAYLKGDDELVRQVENPKLIAWLVSQLDQLCSVNRSKKWIQQKIVDHADYPRLNSELSLAWPCYQAWQQMLKENEQIDFYSMITRATEYVRKGRFHSPWRYIMVDEYQDISPDRVALLEALCRNKKGDMLASLFAVGDDWQSIYQFTGADVDLTTGFAERFESSSIHYLDITYRFNSMIAQVANQFIQKNPDQLEKELKSYKEQSQKAVVICASRRIEKELDELNRRADSRKTVLMLGRNHHHKPELLNDWKQSFYNLDIEFMTCHASKGQEADYVFVLAVNDGQFPALDRQQHLNTVLCKASLCNTNDHYPFAEERRLFYVALTRAKEKVWVTFDSHASVFVKELMAEDYAVVKQS